MVDPLFFVFVAIAVISFGIQTPFNIGFSRRHNPLIFSVYRNVSLLVTMAPVLLLVPPEDIGAITSNAPTLFLASLTGAAALLMSLTAAQYLTIGIGSSLRQAVSVSAVIVLGVFVFGEILSPIQLLLLAGVVGCASALMLSQVGEESFKTSSIGKGITLSFGSGIMHALTFLFFSMLSRDVNPIVASYFWEGGIGVLLLVYLFVRIKSKRYRGPVFLPLRDTVFIVGTSLLTISGTIAYSIAVNQGPFALASGLMSTSILIATAIGWFLFKERIRSTQLAVIVCSVVLIIFLKVVS